MSNTSFAGTVYRSTGSWYSVKSDDGSFFACRIKGKFRLEGMRLTNPIGVGDRVLCDLESDREGIIRKILPRKNYVVRQSPRKKHSLHLIAANVDQAALIVTIVEPMLKQGFIDRFLMMTEPYEIPVLLVFNKSDLYDEEAFGMYEYLHDVYTDIGYETMLLSSLSGEGVRPFHAKLKSKTTLIAGQSGVGKSTLINALHPELDLGTHDLSQYTGKGQHTTTFAEMFDLDTGTRIIDTPGIKNLSFNHLDVKHIMHNFREIFAYSKNCKFADCSHRNEPKCAVQEAVNNGEISELRYYNYLQLLEDTEAQNTWERLKDM